MDDEVLGEVATVEEWILRFDGSSTINPVGAGVVLYHGEGETIALSFKLEFLCPNNIAKYEAYLMGLAVAL